MEGEHPTEQSQQLCWARCCKMQDRCSNNTRTTPATSSLKKHMRTKVSQNRWPPQSLRAFMPSKQGRGNPTCSAFHAAACGAGGPLDPALHSPCCCLWGTLRMRRFDTLPLHVGFFFSFSPVGSLSYGLSTTALWYLHQPLESSGSEAWRFGGSAVLIGWMALLTTLNFC